MTPKTKVIKSQIGALASINIKCVCVLKDLPTVYTVKNNVPSGRKHISVLY